MKKNYNKMNILVHKNGGFAPIHFVLNKNRDGGYPRKSRVIFAK